MSKVKTVGKKTTTHYEVQQRVLRVEHLLCAFTPRFKIVQFCKENYNIAESQSDEYIRQAKENLKEKENSMGLRSFIAENFKNIYRKNMSMEDFREARATLNDLVKLFGIAEPEKHDHTTKGESLNKEIDSLSDSELYEKIKKLEELNK